MERKIKAGKILGSSSMITVQFYYEVFVQEMFHLIATAFNRHPMNTNINISTDNAVIAATSTAPGMTNKPLINNNTTFQSLNLSSKMPLASLPCLSKTTGDCERSTLSTQNRVSPSQLPHILAITSGLC